jgi:hypothetical protein
MSFSQHYITFKYKHNQDNTSILTFGWSLSHYFLTLLNLLYLLALLLHALAMLLLVESILL